MRACAGSSPLTRGTHPSLNVNKSPARFIPAYAGNSILDIVYLPNHSVHPRLRGELISLFDADLDFVGSSPLTRGTRFSRLAFPSLVRFIPAYAGNSTMRVCYMIKITVHPRLRGELIAENAVIVSSTGSSPLTRGTRLLVSILLISSRFIPAYAGNSNMKNNSKNTNPVHPRLRGELTNYTNVFVI